MQRTLRHLGEGILAFVLTFFLFTFSVLTIVQFTLLNPKFMHQQVVHSGYVSAVTSEAHQNISNLGAGSGIPKKVLKSVPSKYNVQQDINTFIDRAYAGAGIKLEATHIKKQLRTQVYAYARMKHLPLNQTTRHAVEQYVNKSVDQYAQSVQVPYLIQIGKNVQAIKQYVLLGLLGTLLLCLVLGSVLKKQVKLAHRMWRYLSYCLTGNGLMLIIAPYMLLGSQVIDRLGIGTKGLYRLVTTYLHTFVWIFIISGLISLAFGLGCIVISEVRRKNRIHRSEVS
ncbi:hypothetical protein FHQ08_03955 [Lactobacillus sp. CC-MHH1034]|uniref:hypothetical protein n=1 Tax=Agrilactobacillus fermenti TaxID=2586909 RepID=UPI001E362BF1|nr:hypothetical protein [Agrilactobacillus fermenti]MCD2255870.1 hypothetical protein [Agrilactobacillus fermenti]